MKSRSSTAHVILPSVQPSKRLTPSAALLWHSLSRRGIYGLPVGATGEGQVFLLDAPVSSAGLFGAAAETVIRKFREGEG